MIIHYYRSAFFLIFALFLSLVGFGQTKIPSFRIVPLGVKGGADESNLSAYMLAPAGSDHYICLDAGTLHAGIEKAIENKVFNTLPEQVLRQNIKGYLISHSHLDHLAGLILNSPDDTVKNIYALAGCIETFKAHYFTWQAWANFGDQGETPQLKKYHYQVLEPGIETRLDNTDLTVQAFPLSHSNLASTAFLVRSGDSYLLYLGDTGPDDIEKSDHLKTLWQNIAPLIRAKKLKAIMIEVSFPNEQSDKTLFGHLTPHWLLVELHQLQQISGMPLSGFKTIITHQKPPQRNMDRIRQQIAKENDLSLQLVYPVQGKVIDLY